MRQLKEILSGGAKLTTTVIAFIAIAFLLFAPFILTVWKAGGIRTHSASLEELKGKLATFQSESASIEMRIAELKKRDRLEKLANSLTNLKEPTAANILIIERDSKGVLYQKNEGIDSFLKRLMGGSK